MLKALLFTAGLSLCSKEHVIMPKRQLTILLVGDSYGVGLSHEFKRLAKENGHKPIVLAREGSLTHEWIKDLKGNLAQHNPDLIIISSGTNDSAASSEWLLRHENDYQEVVNTINETGAELEWILPPKLEEKRLKNLIFVENKIREVAKDNVFDSKKLDIPKASDRIHSTQKGYSDWMDAVWNDLETNGKL